MQENPFTFSFTATAGDRESNRRPSTGNFVKALQKQELQKKLFTNPKPRFHG
jgi:hypothetical protein